MAVCWSTALEDGDESPHIPNLNCSEGVQAIAALVVLMRLLPILHSRQHPHGGTATNSQQRKAGREAGNTLLEWTTINARLVVEQETLTDGKSAEVEQWEFCFHEYVDEWYERGLYYIKTWGPKASGYGKEIAATLEDHDPGSVPTNVMLAPLRVREILDTDGCSQSPCLFLSVKSHQFCSL